EHGEAVVQLGERRRQRGRADADRVGFAVVGDDAAGPEPLDDVAEAGAPDGDVAAAALRVARGDHVDGEGGEPVVDQVEGEVGEGEGLGTDGVDAGLLEQVEGGEQGHGGEDRRGAGHELARARGGDVAGTHGERVDAAHPALDRLAQPAVQAAAQVGERGGARAAVEELVGAADGEVDAPLVEGERDGAGRVAQVEQHVGARGVGGLGDGGGVGEPAGSVDDVGEQHQRGVRGHGACDLVCGDAGGDVGVQPAHAAAALGGDALDDVAVGGEVVGEGDDHAAARVLVDGGVDGGAGELVQQDGGGVGEHGLPGRGAEGEGGDPVADPLGPLHPGPVRALLGPAADQALRPRVVHELVQPDRGVGDGAPEGVAVEVGDDAGGG